MLFKTPGTGSKPSLDTAIKSARDNLQAFLERPDLASSLQTALGTSVDVAAAEAEIRAIAAGSLPPISIVAGEALNGAHAAFDAASGRILVSETFLANRSTTTAALTAVLLEEIGHAIDAKVNATDAPGDEGELFARLVLGDTLSAAEVRSLASQDDHAVITFGGVSIAVEMATQFGTLTLDGSLADWTAADRLDTAGGGVAGYALYGRYAADAFVVALSAPVAIGPNTTFWLNTDRNLATGYQVWGFAAGAEYNINFDAAGVPRLYTGADGQTLVAGAVVDVAFNANRTIAELAISSAALGGSQALDIYTDVNNAVFVPSSYASNIYTIAVPQSVPPVTVGSITLDGNLGDWTSADRIDTSLGLAGYEIYGKLTADNYVMALRAPGAIGANTTAWLNTDRNATTGFQIFGFAGGAEYNVDFDAAGNARLYTGNAGQTAVANGDILERFSTDRTVVEFAIPKELIGFAGAPGAINTLFDINNATFLPTAYSATQYTIAPPTAPIVGTVTLDGNLADWTLADRIDGVAPVAGYEVYGKVSGDSYVFALRAPAGTTVGQNTTAWLNTDQNATTGFQIFGSSGGAEYNINFDSGGTPFLYTGDAGQTPVSTNPLSFGRSADGTTVEFAVSKAAINGTAALNTLIDVNNTAFLPGSFTGPQYAVFDTSGLPARTDFSQKVAIVYSDTTAARYFGDPALPGQLAINQTAYSQLFMAAQNQAAMAGVPYDLLTEADLTNLAKLVNYDAIVFPSFQFVNAAQLPAIETNLRLLAQNYDTSLITAGNFMTADQNGALLAGDPYARMKMLFDLQPSAGGFAGTTSVAVTSAGTGFDGVGGYAAGEAIKTYSNPVGVGWLSFSENVGTTDVRVIDTQAVSGVGAGTYSAVVTSSINGDRNVHFSTEALLGDNNQLWQAIQYAVGGATGPTVGLQMGRQTSIVASRNDMDQSQFADQVNPANNAPGIYDQLMPLLTQWHDAFDFVGSYYINVGDNRALGQETIWAESLPYYQQLLAMGNEIGSHSLTHLLELTPSENTNFLTVGTGPGTFDYEFRQSRDVIQANIGAAVPGYQITGAAVPGAPEFLATSQQIIQYYDYISGGYAAVGAGYPGAFGYLTPAYDDTGQVYLAPNMKFDFTLVGFEGKTAAQALLEWQAELAALSAHAEVPIIMWPWHDYGPTNWENGGYTADMFTQFIATAYNAGAEFVTLEDLADRIQAFEKASVTSSVAGNVITATVTSTDAGNFALDIDNIGTQVIQSVAGWYAYDNDSVFTDRDGGTYAITLGTAAADVTRITALPMRGELLSVTGDGTNLAFSVFGEGKVVVDLKNVAGAAPVVSGATVVSRVGDILTLDLGAIGRHDVSINLQTISVAPVITSNGGGPSAAVNFAENGTAPVTTVTATDGNPGQVLAYAIQGGADAALFTINPTTGALSFVTVPDFETPRDAGTNNVYDIVVSATDNGSPQLSDTQSLAITVTNVNGITYNGTTAANTVTGTPEGDTMSGGAGNDVLAGLGGSDSLSGGADNDSLDGGIGNDTLTGNGGNDTLLGGSGSDRLIGSAGVDVLSGGLDADTFVFATAGESGSGTTRDLITDFQPGIDRIDIGAFDANTTLLAFGTQDFVFLPTAGAVITGAGQLRYRHDTVNGLTFVEGNTNSTLTSMEFQIVLTGIHTLTSADFIL